MGDVITKKRGETQKKKRWAERGEEGQQNDPAIQGHHGTLAPAGATNAIGMATS